METSQPGPLEVAANANNRFEADMLAALLEEEGIEVHVQPMDRAEFSADFEPVDYFEIRVHAEDLSRAKDLLAERRPQLAKEGEAAGKAAEEEEEASEKPS